MGCDVLRKCKSCIDNNTALWWYLCSGGRNKDLEIKQSKKQQKPKRK